MDAFGWVIAGCGVILAGLFGLCLVVELLERVDPYVASLRRMPDKPWVGRGLLREWYFPAEYPGLDPNWYKVWEEDR